MQRKKKKRKRIGSSIILTIILSSWQSICAIFLATHNLHELRIGQGRSYVEARGPLEIFFLSRIHGRIFSYSNASQWQINEINIWLYFSKDMFHNTVHASRMMHVKWYFWWCLVWLINGAEWKQNMFSVFKKLLWK